MTTRVYVCLPLFTLASLPKFTHVCYYATMSDITSGLLSHLLLSEILSLALDY